MNGSPENTQMQALIKLIDRLDAKMDAGFATVNARLDNTATKQQPNAIYDLLDKNIREHEKQEVERAAMTLQLSRHDNHIEQLARNTDTTLHY